MRNRRVQLLIGAAGVALLAGAAFGQASLMGIGLGIDANAVSADGLVVVGAGQPGAFRWTLADGVQYLPQPNGFTGDALGVSANGSVVVGSLEGPSSAHAFRWTGGVTQDLGNATGGFVTRAYGASADGSALAGQDNTGWFRWTVGGGYEPVHQGAAYGISGDGLVIAGGAFLNGGSHAFRWTSAGGVQDLGVLPGGPLSVAYAISGDGTAVVGMSYAGPTSPVDYRPFRWTSGGGMVNLGLLSGTQYGWANAVSGNGSVVGGQMWNGVDAYVAFMWTSAGGMQDLLTALASAGANTPGWSLSNVTGISGDGTVLVGTGSGPGGYQSWIAHLPGSAPPCYANCDASTSPPVLNVADFTCFLQKFSLGQAYANCDGSTNPPTLNVGDFTCFLQKFALGCP
jgi:probable HAF family extracellular repeat protein